MREVWGVCGPLPAAGLGHVAPHEHIVSDSSAQAVALHGAPAGQLAALGIAESERELLLAPVELSNLGWVRRHAMNVDNLALDDEDAAVESLQDFRRLGGTTVVECTPVGLHRDPLGLRRVAERSGVNIVMGSGWYLQDFHPPGLADATVDQLAERIVLDLTEGVGGTGVRSGVIGEIGTSWPIHPVERRVLEAAVRAQQVTGAAIQVHVGRDADAPTGCLDVLEEAGADLGRVSLSHLDRTLTTAAELERLARRGSYLELDMFGQESTYYPYGWFDLPNDAGRVRLLSALVEAGHLERLLISQDLGYKSLLPRWGGPGYAHILREVVPLLHRHGFSDTQVETITRSNPARWLTGGGPT